MPISCCPPGSLGPADSNATPLDAGKTTKGEIIYWEPASSPSSLSKMRVYKVGGRDGDGGNSSKEGFQSYHRAVTVFTDVYGLDSGNHKVFCDYIQEKLNSSFPTVVYCPDLFNGRPLMRDWGMPDGINAALGGIPSILWGIHGRCSAINVDRMLTEIIEPNIKASGCLLPCGVVGFCFGGWVVTRALAVNDTASIFGFGVGIHPGLQVEPLARGGTTEMKLAERTRNKPILFLPAKQDNNAKPTSDIIKYMARRRAMLPCQISIPFESMPHGFVSRGDFLLGTKIQRGTTEGHQVDRCIVG